MTESKIITAKGMCVIALTKYIMKKEQLDNEHAYRKLLESELYKLLDDAGTGLFLEENEYLNQEEVADFMSKNLWFYSY